MFKRTHSTFEHINPVMLYISSPIFVRILEVNSSILSYVQFNVIPNCHADITLVKYVTMDLGFVGRKE